MPRLNLTLTQSVYNALQAEADKRGTPLANLVREYIARGLEQDGQPVQDYRVSWGGKRTRKTKQS